YLEKHQIAVLKNEEFENFTLELDIAGDAMPGVGFRVKDLWNYEFLYCRLFANGQEDALQYTPIYNGSMAWQLYNYPTYEKIAEVAQQTWIHLKLEVYEDNLRVYVGDVEQPNMEIKLLHEDVATGQILLKTSFADGYFANVVVRELKQGFDVEETAPLNGYLNSWLISPQLAGNIYSQRQYYQMIETQEADEEGWKSVNAESSGIVNIIKYFTHPEKSVFAKTTISSSEDQEVTLHFDYSQALMMVLNDQVIYYGYELDSDNFMRMMDGESSISLPLKAGENKLVFWIRSDDQWQEAVDNPPYLGRSQAMNWGFIARLA
ncbi:MAG: hypothetical protein AAFU03_18910, partial [Bacteroidota bacterium]